MRTLLDIGKTYLALNKDRDALKYGREGLNIALQAKSKQFIRDGYQILLTVYDRLNKGDSANFYFREYTIMKEEVLNDQAKAKFAAYNYEQKIALVNKEKHIAEQELEIHQQKFQQQSLQKKFLIIGIIGLFLIGSFIVLSIVLKRKNEKQQLQHEIDLQKLESEKTAAELQQQAAELEMQALRAQMNPHFIFNSLNSINMFILENNKLQASEYLSRFSKLIRLILQNSQEPFIPLEKELEALQLYLQLESLRFDQKFEYKITIDDEIDSTMMKVPPLMIQPYAENAIWHGLMHKNEKGHLDIELYQQDEILFCKITDDGIGREKAAELKSKSGSIHKSVGTKITESRMAIMQMNGNTQSVEIKDLVYANGAAAGTEVIIKIPALLKYPLR
jgi:LytS/YehU family sensor histidine kinase